MAKSYCCRCGIEIEPPKHGLRKYCDGCRTIAFKEEHTRARMTYEAKKKRRSSKRRKESLLDIQKKADQLNMSYGMYVATFCK